MSSFLSPNLNLYKRKAASVLNELKGSRSAAFMHSNMFIFETISLNFSVNTYWNIVHDCVVQILPFNINGLP